MSPILDHALQPPPVLIVGVGNGFRRDDGVGPWLAARLQTALIAAGASTGVEVIELSGEGAGLITAWEGRQRVIVIDAVQSGAAPGALHRFAAEAAPLPRGVFRCSSHQFGPAEAVETARALGRLPTELVLYGIEGADFGYGEALSPEVERAALALAKRLANELGFQSETDAVTGTVPSSG